MVQDAEGKAIHNSPVSWPFCPAIYQGEDGTIAFVGKSLTTEHIEESEIRIDAGEAGVVVSKTMIKRFIDAYLAGKINL